MTGEQREDLPAPGYWITKRKVLMVLCVIVILSSVAVTLPNFFAPRFVSASSPLAIRVRVTHSKSGAPIQGARVLAPSWHAEAFTGADGRCEAIGYFAASGVFDTERQVVRSAEIHLHGTLHVSAPGYQNWQTSVVALFGRTYDYVSKGTSVTCTVTLVK